MKRTFCLLLVSGTSVCLRGLIPEASAQVKDAPPPVYNATAQPAAQPSAAPTGAAAASTATSVPPPSAPAQRSAAELEKLVMPIALHPDPLIAILLPASAYPLEIVQAARFVKDTNNISKVDAQPWDENVKELAKFPDLIAKMDADLPWTVDLGQAFIDQPKELMDTIQSLRGKAHSAGTLRSSTHQIVNVTNIVVIQSNLTEIVTVTNRIVEVVPSNPQVVYVPSYPPTVYYPPPSYVYNPMAPLVTFGVGMAWGAILANNCNWGYGHVDVDVDVDRNVNRNVDRNTNRERSTDRAGNRASTTGSKQWKPDQNRMSKAGAPGAAQSREARGWSGAGASTQPSQRAAAGAGARPSQTPAARTPGASPSISSRPSSAGAGAGSVSSRQQPSSTRPSPSSSQSRSSSAFGGAGGSSSGSSARSASSRGSSSRSGGFGGGGGGRGGGGRGGGRGR